jgi:hypothetical protein
VSTSDYPLLTLPGYELYQLAHLTNFIVDALARHRRAVEAGEPRARRLSAVFETPADAMGASPVQVDASPGGFVAAGAAFPSPAGSRPCSAGDATTPPGAAAARRKPLVAEQRAPARGPTRTSYAGPVLWTATPDVSLGPFQRRQSLPNCAV